MEYFIKLRKLILDVLFPPLCLNCQKHLQGKTEDGVCLDCLSKIQLHTSLFCSTCGLRLANNKKVCHRESKYLLAAAANYNNEVIKNLIRFFKYKSWSKLKNPLGEILINYLQTLNLRLENYLIVPIPLAKDREKERGFNQSLLLARTVADHYQLGLATNVLQRIKNTKVQAELKDFEARKQNVENCFEVANPELIKNKSVILLDDVYTSGATMAEAAKILRASGARKIIALVVAKAR